MPGVSTILRKGYEGCAEERRPAGEIHLHRVQRGGTMRVDLEVNDVAEPVAGGKGRPCRTVVARFEKRELLVDEVRSGRSRRRPTLHSSKAASAPDFSPEPMTEAYMVEGPPERSRPGSASTAEAVKPSLDFFQVCCRLPTCRRLATYRRIWWMGWWGRLREEQGGRFGAGVGVCEGQDAFRTRPSRDDLFPVAAHSLDPRLALVVGTPDVILTRGLRTVVCRLGART